MIIFIVLLLLALAVGIGGIIKGLFWLASIGFILLLVFLALTIGAARRTRT